MNALYPLVFAPVYKQYIWGGSRFASHLGRRLPGNESYAESWEIADHPNGQSVVLNGPLAGTKLSELLTGHGEALLGCIESLPAQFPVMIKLLDATQNLSVQVHPSDQIAAQMGLDDPRGKTEAWIVLDAMPGSRIYAGFSQPVTRELLERSLKDGSVDTLLHSFEPQPGDCIFIPAGTVHALGAGLLIAEVQQMSDTTFRLSDWGRMGADGNPRQLHIAEALEAIDFTQGAVQPLDSPALTRDETSRWSLQPDEASRLIDCEYFRVDRFRISKSLDYTGDGACHVWTILGGKGILQGSTITPVELSVGSTVVIPASVDSLTIKTSPDDPLLIMDTRV